VKEEVGGEEYRRLKRKGLQMTHQRKVVLDAVREASGHPDAQEVYRRARAKAPSISLGTVYRTLGVLCDVGLLRERRFEEAQSRYELEREEHFHAICTDCGLIRDVAALGFGDLLAQARVGTGFDLVEQKVEFYGRCPECQSRN
jgi:Fur family peroxide stress response transcriptional regulator